MIQITYHAHTISCSYTDEPMKNMGYMKNCVLCAAHPKDRLINSLIISFKEAKGSCGEKKQLHNLYILQHN